MKAVLDTNVIVSGIIKEAGRPGQILRLLLEESKFTSLTSPSILTEVRTVLRRDKIRKYHTWIDDKIDDFLTFFSSQSVVIAEKLSVQAITKDPEDDKFLACAEEGDADYIVSGDEHLLALKEYEGIQIVSPMVFLTILQAA